MAFYYGRVRREINRVAFKRGEWAGIPVPVDGMKMVIAKGYPFADILTSKPKADNHNVVNSWFSSKYHTTVGAISDSEGRYHAGILATNNAANAVFDTMRAAATWDIEAEIRAMDKLQDLIPDHLFDLYCLTGMFLESSKRSRVTYIFRRLRPTLAISLAQKHYDWASGQMVFEENYRFLCALCLHPIGYYEGSWAGAMVPTDDLLAHLLLMRADEPYFWKKANHIPCYLPQAGIF